MKNEGLILTVLGGIAVLFLYFSTKTSTPIVLGASAPNTSSTLAASASLAASIAKLFQPTNAAQAIDVSSGNQITALQASGGYTAASAASAVAPSNFTATSGTSSAPYGPSITDIDAMVPTPVSVDSSFLNDEISSGDL